MGTGRARAQPPGRAEDGEGGQLTLTEPLAASTPSGPLQVNGIFFPTEINQTVSAGTGYLGPRGGRDAGLRSNYILGFWGGFFGVFLQINITGDYSKQTLSKRWTY